MSTNSPEAEEQRRVEVGEMFHSPGVAQTELTPRENFIVAQAYRNAAAILMEKASEIDGQEPYKLTVERPEESAVTQVVWGAPMEDSDTVAERVLGEDAVVGTTTDLEPLGFGELCGVKIDL